VGERNPCGRSTDDMVHGHGGTRGKGIDGRVGHDQKISTWRYFCSGPSLA
jgi:hypothetical protein